MGVYHLKFGAAIIITVLLYGTTMVRSIPNTNVTTVLCNSGKYTAGDPFATSLAYVLQELLTTTPKHKSYELYDISPYPNAFAYGHGSCNRNLTSSDCAACLGAAKTAMLDSCQSRIGARAVLHDCAIRYEQYPFTD
ncbi:Gnk2-like domain containing protein [Trema orientale]|uniref:Gnk2-like domain containing protein n=1 Tax=Trema orientale TaxID=63057 RepID=A0A2P5CSD0_TREOI|nr:Gnk2-like domain containing protein [Trema orientale]